MTVAEWTGTLIDWKGSLKALLEKLAPAFGRVETRWSASAFIEGLLSPAERKTGWMLAEQAGLARPYRIQSLLGRSRWSADLLRDLVRDYAVEALGDRDGVLVVDDTGFLKKGQHSVGVARQYSGTAGRIESCQIGVFLSYASRFGHALIDRQLYLPENWASDPERRAKAQVPEDFAFTTKPTMAREMVARTLDAGVPCAWVLADAAYGGDSRFRRMLEGRGQAYVLAVRSNHTLRFVEDEGLIQSNPEKLADQLEADQWRSLTAGEGSKGPRLYDWARVSLGPAREEGFEYWVLMRRSQSDPTKLAYYFAYAPTGTSLAELAGAAGLRWTIEECFLRAKDDLGLDHCEARSWHGWHRHVSLVMAAAAFLAKLSADQRRVAFRKWDKRSPNVAA